MMMSWKVPLAKWQILQLPTAQAGPRNSDKGAQQNLATLLQPRPLCISMTKSMH